MSDSVTKYFEMVEDGRINPTEKETWIFESPDGGKTVKQRLINDIPSSDIKKEAYTILCNHSEEAIRMANKIINGIQR